MAATLGRHHQRTGNQGILPQHQRKNKNKNHTVTQLHCVGDRTRENQGIPTSLQDNSVPGMYLHPWQSDSGSPHI